MSKTIVKKSDLSLVAFAKAEKRKNCLVCKLPPEIREQLGPAARDKKISREQQVQWLELVTGEKITIEELNSHTNGRHDAA